MFDALEQAVFDFFRNGRHVPEPGISSIDAISTGLKKAQSKNSVPNVVAKRMKACWFTKGLSGMMGCHVTIGTSAADSGVL